MPKNGPLSSPYETPLVPTPDVGEATTRGAGITLNTDGAAGLQGSPFQSPLVPTPGQDPTSNTSGIPSTWTTVGNIPDDPGQGTAASVDGVNSPNTPAGNMAEK